MLTLYISLALLGLSAVDPVGIGIMPVLLAQQHPYRRAFAFLGGSFVALVAMGYAFARGLGNVVLTFEHTNTWFDPLIELVAGVVLLGIAGVVFLRLRRGESESKPGRNVLRWLNLGSWQLFGVGALLVAVQSVLDVVFVIAMVKAGQARVSDPVLLGAVVVYAVTALILQVVVVLAFRLAPRTGRDKILNTVHRLIAQYANWAVALVSFALGCVLLALAL